MSRPVPPYYMARLNARQEVCKLTSAQKAGMQGAQPLAGGSGVSPDLLSPLCLPPSEASYEQMSGIYAGLVNYCWGEALANSKSKALRGW